MYALRASARLIRSNPRHLPCKSTLPRYMSIAPSPWFIDADQDQAISTPTPTFTARSIPPHIPEEPYKLSDNIPDTVRALYNELSSSPFLDLSTLVAREPLQIPHGPRVAEKQPKGRRRIRGKTYGGESTLDLGSGGVWNWVVMAQVKEGTENRGSIESVVRVVRKTLLSMQPPVVLPQKSAKQQMHNGWAMIDAGSFAVHIMSKQARIKYFENIENPAVW